MSEWDASLVDPTDRPNDAMLVRAIGGQSGPVAYENGAKITFPWKRQQQIAGSKPGEIWMQDWQDPDLTANGESQTFQIIGADVNNMADKDRPRIRLDSFYNAGITSTVTIAAGTDQSSDYGYQTRIRVAHKSIYLESVPLTSAGDQTDGLLTFGGKIIAKAKELAAPSTTRFNNPFVFAPRTYQTTGIPGSSYTELGKVLLVGHNWLQAARTNGTDPTTLILDANNILQLNPSGGPVQIGGFDYATLATQLGAWTSYTPTLTQGVAITKTVTYARYIKIGRLVVVEWDLACTSAGTAGQAIFVGLPVTAAAANKFGGRLIWFDQNVGTFWCGDSYTASTTTAAAVIPSTGGTLGTGAGGTANAIANADVIRGCLVYEAAA